MNCNDLDLSRTQEVWVQITDKVVPNIKPYYYVSNWGRIGSMSSGTFKLMELVYDSDGYLMINLHLYPHIREDNGLRRQILKRVNRLVIMSFYPFPDNYEDLEVNHINNMRDDNHLWNLEWVTAYENTSHAIKYGYKEIQDISGSKNPMAKLTEDDIYKMSELIKTRQYSCADLSKMFNVQDNVIYNIVSRRSWTHIDLDISEEDKNILYKNGHKITDSFTEDELENICKFFETADINNRSLYPNGIDVTRDCFYSLGLDKKYNFKTKKNTLSRILNKSVERHNRITDKYNYKFIR